MKVKLIAMNAHMARVKRGKGSGSVEMVGAAIAEPTAIVLMRAETDPTFWGGTRSSRIKSYVLNQPPILISKHMMLK